MILIVTSRRDYTADYMILELNKLGIEYVRFNTEDFPTKVDISLSLDGLATSGYIEINDRQIPLESIGSVWYRRPLIRQPSSEIVDSGIRKFILDETTETLNGLWHLIPAVWVSHPDRIRAAESKLFQLKLATQFGFRIPETLVTNVPIDANAFIDKGQTVYKTQRNGKIEHDDATGLIYTNIIKSEHRTALGELRIAPGLFQRLIHKLIELRITVVDKDVFTAALNSQQVSGAEIDWRRVEPEQLGYEPYDLPERVRQQCIALVDALGLKFGAIDMIVSPNREYIFLEINPNGQWAWLEQLCPELHIRDALINLLVEGKTRRDR